MHPGPRLLAFALAAGAFVSFSGCTMFGIMVGLGDDANKEPLVHSWQTDPEASDSLPFSRGDIVTVVLTNGDSLEGAFEDVHQPWHAGPIFVVPPGAPRTGFSPWRPRPGQDVDLLWLCGDTILSSATVLEYHREFMKLSGRKGVLLLVDSIASRRVDVAGKRVLVSTGSQYMHAGEPPEAPLPGFLRLEDASGSLREIACDSIACVVYPPTRTWWRSALVGLAVDMLVAVGISLYMTSTMRFQW